MNATVAVVAATLISAIISAAVAFITGRATAHRTAVEAKGLEAKLPAEVDSIAVQGAGAAVLTMQVALKAAQGRIDDLEAARKRDAEERARDRERMAELETQVDDLRSKVEHAEAALQPAKAAVEHLTTELKRLTAEQDQRRP